MSVHLLNQQGQSILKRVNFPDLFYSFIANFAIFAAMEPTTKSVTSKVSLMDLDVNLQMAGLFPNVDLETSTIQDTATATNLELLDTTLNPELQKAIFVNDLDTEAEGLMMHG